ncbi:MAG: 4-oxalocrotonate tautomerase family protein [Myxococcales bacterium]|nr:4-oxalocrotonate tautomerase family protein [Myxococcales bacterium]
MPYVKIQIAKTGVTAEQKAELIRGATDLLHRVLDKPPSSTYVVIEEIDTDNWGVGGESLTVRRARTSST